MASVILRLICGCALLVGAFITYHRASEHVAAGQPVELFGVMMSPTPTQFTLALVAVSLVGVLMIVLGVSSAVKKRP